MATKPVAGSNKRRSRGWPPGSQDISDALMLLREAGIIPWSWIRDETRHVAVWSHAASVFDYMLERLAEATLNPWRDVPPPMILCESRATAGVLEQLVAPYCCPIAGTAGQVGGFLHTDIAPLLEDNDRQVFYLGDLDKSGADIESNTRGVLERAAGRSIDWLRLGMTQEQADDRGIEPIWKVDGRNGHGHEAIEVEALGQGAIVDLVRTQLDGLLPEPLGRVLEREQVERAAIAEMLEANR